MRQDTTPVGADKEHPQERFAFLKVPLLALLDTLVVELFNHKAFTSGLADFLEFVADAPLALLVDTLIVLVTLVPAFFLRRRTFWCVLVSAVWLLGGAVNGFILLNRMTPFTVSDLTVFQTGIDTLPNYLAPPYIVLLVVGLLGIAAALVLLFWKGPKNSIPLRRRLLSGAAALLLCGGALAGSWTLAFQQGHLSSVFSNLAFAYEDYGFAYCFLQTWLNRGIRPPENYSAEAVEKVRQTIEENAVATTPQTDVNVLFVQLESFIDPAEIEGLELSEPAAPTWNALTEQFSTGYLTVPVVGAGTANTEYEVLTGMSTRLFGPGEYPYQTCLEDQAVESVAYDLKANGYAAHAIHNHRAAFYGRNEVYANLGFDDFTALEYMPQVQMTPRNWAKDYILTSQILKAMDTTPDQSDLVFTVSVQGHGKYPSTPLLQDPEIQVLSCPNEEGRYAFEYYVDQIRQMDNFIRNLITALSRREEKTILVLYGDHLPALDLEEEDMASGILYKTEYIIWDNFGLEKEDKDLYAYQLGAEALGRIGITTGMMNAFHQSCRGEPTYWADQRMLQYDVLYGADYLYGGASPYAPTDMQMGMSPIVIRAIIQDREGWYLLGENFSPYCQVYRDSGGQLDTTYVSPRILRLEEDPETVDPGELNIRVVDKHDEILSQPE